MNRITLNSGHAPAAALGIVLAYAASASCVSPSQSRPPAEPQQATVVASEEGFEPPTLKLRAGVPARITFRRTTDKTCATEVIFADLKIKRDLPLNQPVVIELTPQKGDWTFACGMDMFKGSIVVE
jgi:plastocyanin domain-containing protein